MTYKEQKLTCPLLLVAKEAEDTVLAPGEGLVPRGNMAERLWDGACV